MRVLVLARFFRAWLAAIDCSQQSEETGPVRGVVAQQDNGNTSHVGGRGALAVTPAPTLAVHHGPLAVN